jgi:serine/threonine protein kinase
MDRALAGRFRLETRLGADEIAEVHRARDVRDDRIVRAHVLRLESGSRRERMLREAKRAAQVRHPGLAAIIDVGRTDDDEAFIVTEEPPGESLDLRIARGRLEPRTAVAIATRVCRALAVAHDAGVVHRDLRPSRVFVREEGTSVSVVVQGLGLPHPAASDAYVAPEQRRGEPVGRRADVYSIGAMMYAMLTGSPPGDDAKIDGVLEPVVKRALEADPKERYLDTVELDTELRRALDPSIPPLPPREPSKPPSQKPASLPKEKIPSAAPLPLEESPPPSRSEPRSAPPVRAPSSRPLATDRRAPAAPPPRALGRPLEPRPKWEDAALDVLAGPAPRMLGAAIVAFILARIMATGVVPWLIAIVGAAAGYVSWRLSRSRPGSSS